MKNKFLDRNMFYNLLFKAVNKKLDISIEKLVDITNKTLGLELVEINSLRELCEKILIDKAKITLDSSLSDLAVVGFTIKTLQSHYGDIINNYINI